MCADAEEEKGGECLCERESQLWRVSVCESEIERREETLRLMLKPLLLLLPVLKLLPHCSYLNLLLLNTQLELSVLLKRGSSVCMCEWDAWKEMLA